MKDIVVQFLLSLMLLSAALAEAIIKDIDDSLVIYDEKNIITSLNETEPLVNEVIVSHIKRNGTLKSPIQIVVGETMTTLESNIPVFDGQRTSPIILRISSDNDNKDKRTKLTERKHYNVKGFTKIVRTNLNKSISDANKLQGDMLVSASNPMVKTARSLLDATTDYYHNPIYTYETNEPPTPHTNYKTEPRDRLGYTGGHYGHGSDDHYHTAGEDGSDGYTSSTGGDDEQNGSHESVHQQGNDSAERSEVSVDEEGSHYNGGHSSGAEGDSGHSSGSEGYKSKGHSEESFDNVHRKVEYGYSETFGDDEGSSVHHDDMDDFSSFFDEGNYGGFDGDNFFRSNSHDGFGSSGDSGDGSHHDTHDDHSSEYGQIGYHGDGSSAGDYSAHHGYNSYNEDDLGGYGDDNYGRYDDKDNYEYGNDDEKHYGSSYPYNAARSESKDNFHSSEPPMFARINYKGFNSKK